jgi:hypothetical protein
MTTTKNMRDIALEIGVAPATLYGWRERYAEDFPKPTHTDASRNGGAKYDVEAIERFLHKHKLGIRYEDRKGKRTGRPRSRQSQAIAIAYARGKEDAATTIVQGLSPWWLLPTGTLGIVAGYAACTLLS